MVTSGTLKMNVGFQIALKPKNAEDFHDFAG
jgi:hypothetical protein